MLPAQPTSRSTAMMARSIVYRDSEKEVGRDREMDRAGSERSDRYQSDRYFMTFPIWFLSFLLPHVYHNIDARVHTHNNTMHRF
ncbi:unnamed protein product [Peniophora sp. CBMAI 1063]|nr:unnamed protein product [Peniophora sp. CBMAI 1063]